MAADVSPLKSSAIGKLEPTHVGCYDAEKMQELQRRSDVLKTTDMALIVSPGQNEIQQMQARGQDNWWRNCGKPWTPQRSSVRNAR